MLIGFGKDLDIPLLDMNGMQTERVHHSKLLGVIISDALKWGAHILYINSRAGKRIYYSQIGAYIPYFSSSGSAIFLPGVVH